MTLKSGQMDTLKENEKYIRISPRCPWMLKKKVDRGELAIGAAIESLHFAIEIFGGAVPHEIMRRMLRARDALIKTEVEIRDRQMMQRHENPVVRGEKCKN